MLIMYLRCFKKLHLIKVEKETIGVFEEAFSTHAQMLFAFVKAELCLNSHIELKIRHFVFTSRVVYLGVIVNN